MLPRVYAIVDAACFSSSEDVPSAVVHHARELTRAGIRLIQYRDKLGTARRLLATAREVRRACGDEVRLIMNDRADLCLAANFDGVHVGQDDLLPLDVRSVVGNDLLVGYSTHNPEQVELANRMPVDYVAVGPVFATSSKANPDPVIGLMGVEMARKRTQKPLVAIGGITRSNCRSVIQAGADSIAVISDLLGDPFGKASQFLSLLS